MNKQNKSKVGAYFKNKKIINELKSLLTKLIRGEEITFNQFTGILDKDNYLQFYNRKTLLHQREMFFKEKEDKRSRNNSQEIKMSLNNFVNFLDSLMRKEALDLERFKKTIIYCLDFGIVVGK